MTKLTVAIMVQSLDQALSQAAQAAEHGADLVEYRIDNFTDDIDQIEKLVEQSPLPCIITCRPNWEGGQYDGDDQHRISILEHAALKQPAYIDVELAAYERSDNLRQKINIVVDHPNQLRPTNTGLILSSHDFQTRPADLTKRYNKMIDADTCRVAKVAWQGRSLRDNIEAFEILTHRAKPSIALCMGKFGLPSRILAKKFNALLTFASLTDDATTAPGQVSVATMKQLYRWDKINEKTRVFGVIGWPVGHSMSPHIHNAGFDATNYNGVYLPMPIPDDYLHFKATVGAWLDFKPLHFRGASVTIPHKHNLLKFVAESGGEIEPLAKLIGAANTLTVRDDGSLYASNTDCAAALDSVCHAMGIQRQDLKGQRVTVIGAGGAARAIVAGFAQYGAHVVIYNRTADRAKKLAQELNHTHKGTITAAPLDELPDTCCPICINCTPIGMHPNTEASPLVSPPKGWTSQTVVFDTIYNPIETKLLQQAKSVGCITVSGVEMFVRQAAEQFQLWTSENAPTDIFRAIVCKQLGANC